MDMKNSVVLSTVQLDGLRHMPSLSEFLYCLSLIALLLTENIVIDKNFNCYVVHPNVT